MKTHTTAVIIRTPGGDGSSRFDIITKSDLILFLTGVQGAVDESVR
jgi:hypothetical protein